LAATWMRPSGSCRSATTAHSTAQYSLYDSTAQACGIGKSVELLWQLQVQQAAEWRPRTHTCTPGLCACGFQCHNRGYVHSRHCQQCEFNMAHMLLAVSSVLTRALCLAQLIQLAALGNLLPPVAAVALCRQCSTSRATLMWCAQLAGHLALQPSSQHPR
jgi:hypothetical protein